MVLAGNGLKLLTQEADGHLSMAPLDVPKFEDYELMAPAAGWSAAVQAMANFADGKAEAGRQLVGVAGQQADLVPPRR